MSELELHDRSGPKTVVVLFAYGGIHAQTNNCLIRDLAKAAYVAGRADVLNSLEQSGSNTPPMRAIHRAWDVRYAPAPPDALVSRSRAVAASRFLAETDAEVLIMLDHDLWWAGPSVDYEGDLLHIARQCADTRGIVAATVSKKVRGQGIASMIMDTGSYNVGLETQLARAWYVGGAFTAYHRSVVKAVSEATKECVPGFKPIFMESVVDHPLAPGKLLHLSEDWAFCHYARQCGHDSYLSFRPLVIHYGEYGYQVVRDSQPEQDSPESNAPTAEEQHYTSMPVESNVAAKKNMQPRISCLHATRGRPALALAAYRLWMSRARDPSSVEYIFSADSDDGSMADWIAPDGRATVFGSSRGCVDAYNRAYSKAATNVMVQVHDDLEPPFGWDQMILDAIEDQSKPVVLWVDDGAACNPSKPELMTLAIGTRAFFDELGGLFFPEYVSLYCDDDLTRLATERGYRKDARNIKFKHHWSGADRDETQRRSYAIENWEQGKALFERRWGSQ